MTEEFNIRRNKADKVREKKQGNIRFAQSDYHQPMMKKFGERYREYRREWEGSADGTYLPPFPIQLDLEIIDYCNLQCIMCPRSISRGSGVKLPLDDFKKIIDEGAANGLRAILFGSIDEPLLDDDLLDMIDYANSKGIMDIRLNTNATRLRPALSQKLLTSGLTYISFSIDAATKQTYQKIRGGDFEKVEDNINTFLDMLAASGQPLPKVRVSFAAMPENLDETEQFINKWNPRVDVVEIQEFLQLDAPKVYNKKQLLQGFTCFQPWQRLTVTARGNFAPCCTFNGLNLLKGNIHEVSIADCWNSEQINRLREKLMNKKPPRGCIICYASRYQFSEI